MPDRTVRRHPLVAEAREIPLQSRQQLEDNRNLMDVMRLLLRRLQD
jgi:hypothetical protein